MTVRHLWNDRNEPFTEALYEHDGQPCCSRFLGHLDAPSIATKLERYRKMDARKTA